ncbi:MAG: hypothetical protein AB7S26_19500 [Sandaracinaceae bacterium]
MRHLAVPVALVAALVACSSDTTQAPVVDFTLDLALETTDELDLLLMIDSSSALNEEQANFARSLPSLISGLSADADGDGQPALSSLHVAVITADMGTGGFTVPTCANPELGDDGLFRTEGNPALAGCAGTHPSFVEFAPGDDTATEEVTSDVACVASNLSGCGFEQPLEAILKALSPSQPRSYTALGYSPPRFFMDTTGHGDGPHDGFLRDGSVLGIVLLTDEDDCSARDPELFNPNSATYTADPNVRCIVHEAQALHPADRYVEGFLALRRTPGRLVFVPIVGVPPDLAPPDADRPNFGALVSSDALLRDDRMEPQLDPANPQRLVAACNEPATGLAYPPARIMQVAERLDRRGARVSVGSICRSDLGGTVAVLTRRLLEARETTACLPLALARNADLRVPCDVFLVPPPEVSCEELEGASPHLVDGIPERRDERAVCVLDQLAASATGPAPSGAGWYYDTTSPELLTDCPGSPRRITISVPLPADTRTFLECTSSLAAFHSPGGAALGDACDPLAPPDGTCETAAASNAPQFTCDLVDRVCSVRCAVDSDCNAAGLFGFRCDLRPLSELAPDRFEPTDPTRRICVPPEGG